MSTLEEIKVAAESLHKEGRKLFSGSWQRACFLSEQGRKCGFIPTRKSQRFSLRTKPEKGAFAGDANLAIRRCT